MYLEFKSDDPERIISELRKAMDSDDLVSVTLNKRGDLYVATLVQATETDR
jgi:hypothetical protein